LLFVSWVVFHVIVCIALIIVVLMQSAKGEGLAGGTAFGGAVSSAVFGGRGAASFLSKATTVLAIVFFVNCGALALMSSSNRIVASDGTTAPTTESSVTRQAQAERDQALEQRQRQQDAAATDSAARQAGETPLVPSPTDTTAPSGN
jgi:preprotein translocase subunit SecG